ncbi:hypothetical protein ITG10_00940 [Vibrio sp. ED004]|uniref:hypothetical protein n=1 Tax=unclassified Vibrio TaxID=2614977 RepID=UPI00036C8CCC|nr:MULTISPECIES: hypothetical protein [unclassified Vibrio]UPR56967.1 hypothetical protein ITG10_00940 [Vibrio sp. ED004]
MNKFTDCKFENTTIGLDNTIYKKCTFTNCVIEYAGDGPISLESCEFNNCQWTLVGAAQNTMQFLSTMHHSMGDFGKQMVDATFNNIKKPRAS